MENLLDSTLAAIRSRWTGSAELMIEMVSVSAQDGLFDLLICADSDGPEIYAFVAAKAHVCGKEWRAPPLVGEHR